MWRMQKSGHQCGAVMILATNVAYAKGPSVNLSIKRPM